jgi:adenosylcobinamide kinase/adenosylcobinamide-phosphate guanylyltransferase
MGKGLTLILGGARSGKSRHAQELALERDLPVLFVATATAGDAEMASRIAAHRAGRPGDWETLEAPLQVGEAILKQKPDGLVLVDCLTLLANNVLSSLPEGTSQEEYQAALDNEIEALLAAYRETDAEWLVISNEVGLGLVPPYPAGRMYRDALGQANQRVAQAADEVVFLVAGVPMRIKNNK